MSRVLIIGAGGVGQVVAHKCAQVPEVFTDICLASRSIDKCSKIASQIRRKIQTAEVDADNVPQLVKLIRKFKPDVVINVALPYQDLHIMDACLETGVDYLDTANYESPGNPDFCYKWQWAYGEKFRKRGIMALLGSGFDPGVTNVFTAWAQKKHFKRMDELDIIDCNAGNHGKPFATNFNPEINIREVTGKGRFYDDRKLRYVDPLSVSRTFYFPSGIGPKKVYLMYHEELESLVKNFKSIRKARFWMTFSDSYLLHLKALQDVGMTRIDEVEYKGMKIVPLQFLKAILPDPASLGQLTKGKTCIGCQISGIGKDGRKMKYFIYNICDHQKCYREVKSQAISYTTGVPAMIGAMLMVTGVWKKEGVHNMEEFDPEPFMNKLKRHGLPWKEVFLD